MLTSGAYVANDSMPGDDAIGLSPDAKAIGVLLLSRCERWHAMGTTGRFEPFQAVHSRTYEDRPCDRYLLVTGAIGRCGG